jgi:hypothetical protein
MSRTLEVEPVYDVEEAQHFIAKRTGEPLSVVEKYQAARFAYQDELAAPVKTLNDPRGDLRVPSYQFDAEEILKRASASTGLNAARVAKLIAAEVAYMVAVDMMPTKAARESAAWAHGKQPLTGH